MAKIPSPRSCPKGTSLTLAEYHRLTSYLGSCLQSAARLRRRLYSQCERNPGCDPEDGAAGSRSWAGPHEAAEDECKRALCRAVWAISTEGERIRTFAARTPSPPAWSPRQRTPPQRRWGGPPSPRFSGIGNYVVDYDDD